MKNILIKTFYCILLGLAFSELMKFSFFLMNMSSTIAFFVGVSILLGGIYISELILKFIFKPKTTTKKN
jgi:hypothetical protein